MMGKAVVFDLDGVYFESGTENFIAQLIEKYGLTKDQIEEVYFRSEQMQQFKRGEITSDEFWSYALQAWGLDIDKGEVVELLLSGYSVKPETDTYVKLLRERGVKTAICTNNFPDRFEGLRDRFNLESMFDVIITSYQLGITKPDARVFQALAAELGLDPADIIMADDREVNVEALKELGFAAFLYTGWEDFVNQVNLFLEGYMALNFTSKNNTEKELKQIELLQQITEKYPVPTFTDKILVAAGEVPHSHPVLTLNTRSQDQLGNLQTLVHEQFHWHAQEHDQYDQCIDYLKGKYEDDGEHNNSGTYPNSYWEHIIVCFNTRYYLQTILSDEDVKYIYNLWQAYPTLEKLIEERFEVVEQDLHQFEIIYESKT